MSAITMVIDDDVVEIMTIKRAFRKLGLKNKLLIMRNGEEALAYLLHPQEGKPDLIFLDLNMPRINGIEFLEAKSNHKCIANIPVVVLTTSSEGKDISLCQKFGSVGYFVKPLQFCEFTYILGTILKYWYFNLIPPPVKIKR